jgi:sulfur carrier protein
MKDHVVVNGKTYPLEETKDLGQLLQELSLEKSNVAIAINQNFISRTKYKDTLIQPNDKIDIVAPMAGG